MLHTRSNTRTPLSTPSPPLPDTRAQKQKQATLGDSFLDDLDELGDLSEEDEDGVGGGGGGTAGAADADSDDDDDDDDDDNEGNLDDVLGILKDATGIRSVAKLRVLPRFVEHMRQVELSLATKREGGAWPGPPPRRALFPPHPFLPLLVLLGTACLPYPCAISVRPLPSNACGL